MRRVAASFGSLSRTAMSAEMRNVSLINSTRAASGHAKHADAHDAHGHKHDAHGHDAHGDHGHDAHGGHGHGHGPRPEPTVLGKAGFILFLAGVVTVGLTPFRLTMRKWERPANPSS
eukprot:TRINITY_DN131_c0_g1_i1.p1 TRINITY_DN131_c0_g1~~TRINITY_DN131_c0_g1_i1.p1  ORF type:complete len:117 (-),score=8.54 TRINITY_DN131_c0_g1_i1:43-393(-)